jgi:hypothetical protein
LGGWVVIAFSLKGDGWASDLRILEFEPKDDRALVQHAGEALKRSNFKPGVVQENCVRVGSFDRR